MTALHFVEYIGKSPLSHFIVLQIPSSPYQKNQEYKKESESQER